MTQPLRLLSVGEPLVELFSTGADTLRRQVGGDTLNTAIYAARLLGPGRVGYHTALGTDPMSDWVMDRISAEGIATGTIGRVPGAPVGLCAVHTDDGGERSFTYWRAQSPARDMLEQARPFDAGQPDILFTSAVTLAILRATGRARLLEVMASARESGGITAFDLNLRPALWPDIGTARKWVLAAVRHATLVLPSEDDAAVLWPRRAPDDVARILLDAGADEVVLTMGGAPVVHGGKDGITRHALPAPIDPVDTTGAGDAFNAGFLAALGGGESVPVAIDKAHHLASHVVGFRGAVIAREDMP